MPTIPPTIYAITLFVWLVLFLLGKFQYDRLRKRILDLAMSQAESMLRKDHALSVEQCYEALMAQWPDLVKRSAWFIPHKTELWPMPASPEYVRERMNITPLWLGAFLSMHGFHLRAAPELQSQIDRLVHDAELSQQRRNIGRGS